jgi:very-short-patch-repair endonuclease
VIKSKNFPLPNPLPKGEGIKDKNMHIPPLPPGEGRGEGKAPQKKGRRPSTLQSRKQRQNQTDAEKLFWHSVKAKRFSGYKFRRQFPVGPFYADFVCVEAKLVVEIDGGQHNENQKDITRTLFLNKNGYEVIRFWNNEILGNIEGVLLSLSLTLSRRERELKGGTV